MKRVHVEVRDVQNSKDCKPKVLDFIIEGAVEDLRVVLDSLRLKYPEPQYKMDLTSEWKGYTLLKPNLMVM